MADFNPCDTDIDGDFDGIDFLGFDYLMGHVLGRDEDRRQDEGVECEGGMSSDRLDGPLEA